MDTIDEEAQVYEQIMAQSARSNPSHLLVAAGLQSARELQAQSPRCYAKWQQHVSNRQTDQQLRQSVLKMYFPPKWFMVTTACLLLANIACIAAAVSGWQSGWAAYRRTYTSPDKKHEITLQVRLGYVRGTHVASPSFSDLATTHSYSQDGNLGAQIVASICVAGLAVSCLAALAFLVLWAGLAARHPRLGCRKLYPVLTGCMPPVKPLCLARHLWVPSLVITVFNYAFTIVTYVELALGSPARAITRALSQQFVPWPDWCWILAITSCTIWLALTLLGFLEQRRQQRNRQLILSLSNKYAHKRSSSRRPHKGSRPASRESHRDRHRDRDRGRGLRNDSFERELRGSEAPFPRMPSRGLPDDRSILEQEDACASVQMGDSHQHQSIPMRPLRIYIKAPASYTGPYQPSFFDSVQSRDARSLASPRQPAPHDIMLTSPGPSNTSSQLGGMLDSATRHEILQSNSTLDDAVMVTAPTSILQTGDVSSDGESSEDQSSSKQAGRRTQQGVSRVASCHGLEMPESEQPSQHA